MAHTTPDQLSGAYRWRPNADESFVDEHYDYQPADPEARDTTTGTADDVEDDPLSERTLDQDIRDGSLFKREIQRDPEICSSCFLPNYDVILPHTWRAEAKKNLVRYFKPIESTTRSENGAAPLCRGPPRACECGRIGPARIRPLNKRLVARFTANLSRTLTRKQLERERRADEAKADDDHGEARKLRAEAERFEHDPLLLAFLTAFYKRIPERATRDDSNIAEAVDNARHSTAFAWPDLLGTKPALPEPDDESRRRAHHGRPATVETDR